MITINKTRMVLYLLNLFDLAFTLYALQLGAEELNPLMQSVPIMVFYKIVIVGLFCMILHRYRARRALGVCAVVYAAVNIWHIINIFPHILGLTF